MTANIQAKDLSSPQGDKAKLQEINPSGVHGLKADFIHEDAETNCKPSKNCFISFGTGHNRGNSFLDNLIIGLLDQQDVTVLLHSGDPLSVRIPQLLGAKYQYPTRYSKRSGYYLKRQQNLPPDHKNFPDVYEEAKTWLNEIVHAERLIPVDDASMAPQSTSLEVWVRSIRFKYPTRKFVVIVDNFYRYHTPGCNWREANTDEMATFMNRLATEYRCSILMTVPGRSLPNESALIRERYLSTW